MKRNEMIDEIACCLLVYGTNYPQYPLHNLVNLAEEILSEIEKHMLPPPKQVDIINDRLFYAYYPEGSISEKSEDANKIDIKELWEKE